MFGFSVSEVMARNYGVKGIREQGVFPHCGWQAHRVLEEL